MEKSVSQQKTNLTSSLNHHSLEKSFKNKIEELVKQNIEEEQLFSKESVELESDSDVSFGQIIESQHIKVIDISIDRYLSFLTLKVYAPNSAMSLSIKQCPEDYYSEIIDILSILGKKYKISSKKINYFRDYLQQNKNSKNFILSLMNTYSKIVSRQLVYAFYKIWAQKSPYSKIQLTRQQLIAFSSHKILHTKIFQDEKLKLFRLQAIEQGQTDNLQLQQKKQRFILIFCTTAMLVIDNYLVNHLLDDLNEISQMTEIKE